MKYIITEKQLKTLRKYMKSFINENVVRGDEALDQFPFSELPETYEEYKDNRFKLNIKGWDRIDIPSGGDSLRGIKTKEDLFQFISQFKKQYGEEPMFEINPNADWHSKIQITNPSFQEYSERAVRNKASQLDRDREQGWSID
jgi:hypothetical protein